jgi:thiol-disulfide isomerase/thioredoxin
VKLAVVLVALLGCAAGPRAASPAWRQVAAKVELAGAPAVFVVFASWCSHCRDELAMLGELHAERPELRIVGLNAYEDWEDRSNPAQLAAYVAEHAPWLPVVRADEALLAALGGVPKIPSLFVFDAEGRLVKAFRRHEREQPSKAEIVAALAEP